MNDSDAPTPTSPRFLTADRQQLRLVPTHIDALLEPDHRARVVWAFVKGLDLRAFYGRIRSVEGAPGRPAIDPAILLSLWLYATIEGVGSARALEELCETHDAYRWICGGVGVNHHTLSDFRSEHPDELDEILAKNVAALMEDGLVELDRVAQDGMRVRAEAGSASFRTRKSLTELFGDAEKHVKRLRTELHDDPSATSRRQKAAMEQKAKDRVERVRRALEAQKELEAIRAKQGQARSKAKASTTDPDARVMKMADGGFRPAYNGQFATTTDSQVIVGVLVTNRGSDTGLLRPMCEKIARQYGRSPAEALADSAFVKHDDIEALQALGTRTYAPVPKRHFDPRGRHDRHPDDGPVVAEWRRRMRTRRAQEIYRERTQTAECVNAIARNRGLVRVFVRGLRPVKAVFLLFALAHNCMRAATLRARAWAPT